MAIGNRRGSGATTGDPSNGFVANLEAAASANVARFYALINGGTRKIRLPEGRIWTNSTVVFPGEVQVVGEGLGDTIVSTVPGFGGDTFRAGIPLPNPGELTGVGWNLNGHLDGSVSGRTGLVLTEARHAGFGTSMAVRPATWANATGLELRFAVDGPIGNNQVFGSSQGDRPNPVQVLGHVAGTVCALYQTEAGLKLLDFPRDDSITGLHRYRFTYDYVTGVATWYMDGAVKATTAGGQATPGSKLVVTDAWWPVKLGASGDQLNFYFTDDQTLATTRTLRLAGLHLRSAISADPSTDLARYFTADASTVLLLPLTQNEASLELGQLAAVTQAGTEYGQILTPRYQDAGSMIRGPRLKDLSIVAYNATGKALNLGWALYTRAENVAFAGGAAGLGDDRWGTAYTTELINTEFGGDDGNPALSNVLSWYGTIKMRESRHWGHPADGTTIRSELAVIHMKDSFFSYPGGPRHILATDSGELVVDDANLDTESSNDLLKLQSVIKGTVNNNRRGQSAGAFIRVEGLNLSKIGSAPIVELVGESAPKGKLWLAPHTNLFQADAGTPAVECTGDGWEGAIWFGGTPPITPLQVTHPERFTVDGVQAVGP